jgi:hypothetical protein
MQPKLRPCKTPKQASLDTNRPRQTPANPISNSQPASYNLEPQLQLQPQSVTGVTHPLASTSQSDSHSWLRHQRPASPRCTRRQPDRYVKASKSKPSPPLRGALQPPRQKGQKKNCFLGTAGEPNYERASG